VRSFKPLFIIGTLAALFIVGGCAPLAITALGVGGQAGMSHAMNGVAYRTFTAPMANVRIATLLALSGMNIQVDSSGKQSETEFIKATASDRQIEIELESISPTTTRMRSVAKQSTFMYDSATATEIIQQTEKLLRPQQKIALQQELALRLW
jgi:Protein of unknown function (DUF3568)